MHQPIYINYDCRNLIYIKKKLISICYKLYYQTIIMIITRKMNSNILFKVVLQLTIMNEHIIMARRKGVIIKLKSKRTTVVKKN